MLPVSPIGAVVYVQWIINTLPSDMSERSVSHDCATASENDIKAKLKDNDSAQT